MRSNLESFTHKPWLHLRQAIIMRYPSSAPAKIRRTLRRRIHDISTLPGRQKQAPVSTAY